jgi:hypothetical protein
MKTTLRLFVLFCAGILFSALTHAQTGCTGKSVLIVGTDPAGLGDSTVREHLASNLGFTTTYMAPAELDVGDVLTYDMILLSSTISSTDGAMFKDVEVPLVCMESFSLDVELGMVQDPAQAGYSTMANVPYVGNQENSFDSLMVSNSDSVVSIGLDAGYAGETIEVFFENVPYGSNRHPGQWGVPNENAYLILEYKQSTLDMLVTEDLTLCGENGGDFCANARYAAFAYPKGVEMAYDGTLSPEKRSFYFFHDYSASVATDEAWEMFNALIYWSMGCLDRPEATNLESRYEKYSVNIYPNPAKEYVNIDFKFKSEDPFEIQLLDALGRQVYHQVAQRGDKFSDKIKLKSSGFYFIKVKNLKTNKLETIKVVSE